MRPLGAICLLDQGEVDWKLLTVLENHAKFDSISDVDGLQKHYPYLVHAIREWLRTYKVPEGKGLNEFRHDGKAMSKGFAMDVVSETHLEWRNLLNDEGLLRKHGLAGPVR